MISFIELTDSASLLRVRDMLDGLDNEAQDDVGMMLDSFLALADEVDGVGATATDGCLIVRVCDGGEYMFLYPFALSADADEGAALISISEYARRELLPLRLTDVPREGIGLLTSIFPHVDARAYDDDEDTFAAIVLNELDMADAYPTVTVDVLTLSPLRDTDAAAYARLCSDRALNAYWGFDDLADNPTADPEVFMLIAEREMRDGIALSLAVRRGDEYLGEAVVYDLDYRGSAEIGIRILPEYHGDRLGSRVLSMLVDYCRRLGIRHLRARVMAANIPAVRMTSRYMTPTVTTDGVTHFALDLG